MRLHYDAAMGLIRRDWLLFTSYRTQALSMVASIFTSLALFYFVSRLVTISQFETPDHYFAFVVVGMVILQVLQSTFGVAATLRGELLTGTFERLVLSPFGAVASMVSMMLFPFITSVISGVVLLVMASLIYGVHMTWNTAALAIPIALLGTGAFASFGMAMTAVTLVFKRAVGGIGLLLTLITLTSGIYFPIALLPGWMQWISEVQPFTPAVELLRHVLVGTPMEGSEWTAVAKVIGFASISLPIAFAALKIALHISQRRGTIIEY
ncbi:MAG TPA: ABC transporter permease [Thermoleophilaceae bacterium]|nr:ABC transporter permease [Thermoleophilaceae bacterium]